MTNLFENHFFDFILWSTNLINTHVDNVKQDLCSFDVLSLGESKKWGSNENKEMTLPLMKFG
jgi:hypothetical protein